MKNYMDIENLREFEEVIGDIVRSNNTKAFEVGDDIQITEKYDGSNASIEKVNGEILCYSRKKQLDFSSTLNGFYNFILEKNPDIQEDIVIFGEWSGVRNKIVYTVKNDWFVFDIYDKINCCYWNQDAVEAYCKEHGFTYIHVLYRGPFISWKHCRTFMHSPFYGEQQEGIVVKNQSKLVDANDYYYLKIVNDDFKEKIKVQKVRDPQKEIDENNALTYMSSIITRARVEKMLFKLRDEGIINSSLAPTDMPVIAKNLPKRIFEDCIKEEKETVIAAGEYAGKACSSIAMKIVKSIILGE